MLIVMESSLMVRLSRQGRWKDGVGKETEEEHHVISECCVENQAKKERDWPMQGELTCMWC